MAQRLVISVLSLIAVITATGCSSHHVRTNLSKMGRTPATRTIQIFASSSIGGHPMGDDSTLRDQVAKAFQRQFPGIRSDESQPDMVVFFTIVDYVPGCLPNCKKFKTYRNWSCEVEIFAAEPETLVFNLDGTTYNPFHDPVANCASQLTKALRSLNSTPNS